MDIWRYSTDVSIFVVAGIVLAFLIGPIGDFVAQLSIVILILQMTASIHGLHVDKDDFSREMKPSLISFVCCFGICSGSAILMGLLLIGFSHDMWYGWVMLAAVPSAVSCVTTSMMMKGNMAMTMISMVLIYALALVITPVMTLVLIGDAVSPLQILKYIILFIAIPVLANIPLGKVKIEKKYKVTFINCMMMLLLIFSMGQNRDFILGELGIIALVIIACAVRTFGVAALMIWWMKRHGTERSDAVVFTSYAVWKNSGLATSMCMLLLAVIPEAALPCAVSLVMEAVWFAVSYKLMQKHWPAESTE